MRWTAPLQRHRNVPIRESGGLKACYILAFAEWLLLANNGHETAFRLRPLSGVKQTWNHRCLLFRFLRPLSGVKRTLYRLAFMSVNDPKRTRVECTEINSQLRLDGRRPIPEGGDPCDTASICDAFGIELVAKARRRSPYPGQSAV